MKSHMVFRFLPKSVMTLNGVMTTDARYLCGSWDICYIWSETYSKSRHYSS